MKRFVSTSIALIFTVGCVQAAAEERTNASHVRFAKPITCSGKIWNLWKNDGTARFEIGHGVYQCSVVDVTSEAGKKILSVCNFGKRCTFSVKLAPVPKEEMENRDDVEVTERDTVLWVRPGARNDSGAE